MWLLTILPNWVFYLAFVASIISGYIGTLLAFRITQVASILVLLTSVWFLGGISNNASWEARVKDLEFQVAAAEAKSAVVNTKIVTETVTKIQKVKEIVYVNKEVIKEVVAKQLDTQCTIPVSAISVHNSASQNEVSSGASSIDGNPSDIKASELLSTVAENYGTYYEVVEKLKGWQTWYIQQKKIFEEIK